MSSPTPELTAGTAAVRSWCGWHIAPTVTETVRVEGEGGRVALLPSLHVTACSDVRNEDGAVQSGWKVRRNGIARGSWAAEVEYEFDITHGYDTMPSELQAIIDGIDATGVGSTVRRQSSGPFSVEFGSPDLESQPLSVRAVIQRYRIPPRP